MMDPVQRPESARPEPTNVPITRREDLVERTRDERSLIKLLALALPGYRGYRQREDIRQADALLRACAARDISASLTAVKAIRSQLSRQLEMVAMGSVVERLAALEAALIEIGHAEQGYSDSRSALRVQEEELLRLYETDVEIVELAGVVRRVHETLPADPVAVSAALAESRSSVDGFRRAVAARRQQMLSLR